MRPRSRSAAYVIPGLLWGIAICTAVALPELDLCIERQVHDALGGRFAGTGGGWALLYVGVPYAIYAVTGCALAVFAAGLFGWPPARRRFRGAALVLGTIMVHVLVVETLLKNHWGRARPRDLTEFGGFSTYTAPLVPADQCASNCAFVSGHASAAFTLFALALAAPAAWRVPAAVAAVAFGLLVGAMRVLQGAHFAFDIVFAGLIICSAALVIDRMLPAGMRGER